MAAQIMFSASSLTSIHLVLLLCTCCSVTLCLAWSKAATITTTTGISSNDLGTYSLIKSTDKIDSKSPSLFNSFNQYTVDQLLVKVPSILEEPDDIVNIEPTTSIEIPKPNETLLSSSSSSEILLNDLSTIATTSNQNVFQNESANSKPQPSPSTTSSSPEQNLLAKNRNRYRSIKKLLSQITFNCSGRPEGYYSDPEFDCRIFHYCKRNGFKFTFICPGSAVFNQKELTCDSSSSSSGRNSERTCRSSVNYYFLNSVLYSKDGSAAAAAVPQLKHLQQLASASPSPSPSSSTLEQISTEAVNEDATADGHFSDDSFGKWVTYISTTGSVPLPTVLSSSNGISSVKGKPKRNRVRFEETPHLTLLPDSSSRKLGLQHFSDLMHSSSPAKQRKLDRHSSELSVLHGSPPSFASSSSLPDFLLTSPSPPMEQIDTPRWFPEKNTTDLLTEHQNSENSVNKYTVDSGDGGDGIKPNSNNYILTATVSTTSTTTSEDHRLKAPSEVNEVVNAIDASLPSKVLFPGQPANRPRLQTPSSTKPPKQSPNPFHVDWDDDDQLLVEEFHKRQQQQQQQNGKVNLGLGGLGSESVVHSNTMAILGNKGPSSEQEETANYLFGKPMEPLPPAIQFSPVDFETLLEKIPQQLHTLPVGGGGAPFMDYHQQQMMAHFGQFAPPLTHLSPEALQMVNQMAGVSSSAKSKKHQPHKSQFKVLFGNLVRGGGAGHHHQIGRRRWSPGQDGQQASPLPFIWPLVSSMFDGGNSFQDKAPHRRRSHHHRPRQPSYYPISSWNYHQPTINVRPMQMFEVLQRRTDRNSQQQQQHQQNFAPHPPGWKSSLITLLSRITNLNSPNSPNRPIVNY